MANRDGGGCVWGGFGASSHTPDEASRADVGGLSLAAAAAAGRGRALAGQCQRARGAGSQSLLHRIEL